MKTKLTFTFLSCVLKVPFFIFVSLILICGTSKAQLTASATSGCAPLVGVQFTSPASLINANWNFGDQTSSNLNNPTHTFITAGNYMVLCTGILAGNPFVDSILIRVFGKPFTSFTAQPPLSGCVPLNVIFRDSSIGGGGSAITARQWAFGDGGTNVGNNGNPSYLYSLAGSFTVSLKVTDANGCDTAIAINNFVNVSIPPNGIITTSPNPPTACLPPLNVSFSGAASTSNSPTGGGLTYFWNLGGGNTSTAVTPPPVNYTTSGIFPVTLIVKDNNNCPDTVSTSVIISSPFASFYAQGAVKDTVCTTVIFKNQSIGNNPVYTYGDGTSGTDSIHVYTPGTYQVSLQVQNGLCFDDTTITIHVENVVANFTSTPHYSCNWPFTVQYTNTAINGATYQWIFGDGGTSTLPNPSHTFTLPDTNQYTIFDYYYYSDTLTVTSVHGCSNKFFKNRNDTVFKITARFMPDKVNGCAPLTVTFSDSSRSKEPIAQLIWLFGDGTQNVGNNTPVSHTYTQPGVYYVRLVAINSAGCRDTSFIIPIYVGSLSTPNFSIVPNNVCPNTPVQFTDLTPAADSTHYWHYSADGGIMSSCYTDRNPIWNFNTQTGPQNITLTTVYNGCAGSTTLNGVINVKGPMGRFYVAGNCSARYTYNFPAILKDASFWNWDFGDGTGLTNSTNANPSHTYAATGDYWVKLTAFNPSSGCAPAVDSAIVHVRNRQANFASDSVFCKGSSVLFNASSSIDAYGNCNEGYLFYWNDGTHPNNSASSIATHVFANSGTYRVKLVITDINGCVDSVKRKVDVYGVTTNFKSNKTYGCLPLTVNFTDSSFADTTIASYSWSFGDGAISTIQNPTHTYTTIPPTGYWLVTLTVNDVIGCSNSKQIIIRPSLPDTLFSVSKTNICVGEVIQFVPNNVNQPSFSWNFGDATSSSLVTPTHAYNAAGTYTVTFTVTDSIGCVGSKKMINFINVQAYPIAGFTNSASGLTNKCYPLFVNFVDTSIVSVFGSRQWNLGNGGTILTSDSVGTIYQTPGLYIITLIETSSFGCRDTAVDSIRVVGPVGNFTISPTTICKGETVTFTIINTTDVAHYSWDFGDGTIASGTSPISHTFNINPVSGFTYVGLVMWSADSACTATKLNPVFIQKVIADFSINNNDTILCVNEPVTIVNNSLNASVNNWTYGNGQNYNGVTPPVFQYANPGTYTIALAISNNTLGCKDTLRRKVIVNALPTVSAAGGDTCLGQPVTLFASGGATYQWSPTTGLSNSTVANPVATPSQSTNYTVLVTDVNGCTGVAQAPVLIYGPPPQTVTTTTIIIGDSVHLITGVDSSYTFTWNPIEGLSCTACPAPWAQPFVNTLYIATYTDKLGCYTGESRFNVEINPLVTIDVPTAFTPNGDGGNDIIFVKGWGIKKLIEFKIYNRWGQLLFETNDINKGWNGYYKGELQPVETYVYTAKAETFLNGKVISKKGSFNLIR